MYILKSVNTHGDEFTVPFRSLSKLIQAYKSEKKFNSAQMFIVLNGEKIALVP